MNFLSTLTETAGWPARWQCGHWSAWHGWVHIVSDIAIWGAYLTIPFILIAFIVRKKDIPFHNIFLLFGAFIFACGSTHWLDAAMFWWPAYRLLGLVKAITALVSWGTVVALLLAMPKLMVIKTTDSLKKQIKQAQGVRMEVVGMFMLAFVVLFGIAALIYSGNLQQSRDEQWVTHTHEVIENLQNFRAHMKDVEAGERTYLLTGKEETLAPYTAAKQMTNQDIKMIAALSRDNPHQQGNLKLLTPLMTLRLQQLDNLVALQKAGRLTEINRRIRFGTGIATMANFNALVQRMIEEEHRLLKLRSQNAQNSAQQALFTLTTAFLVVFGLLGAALYVINREMSERMQAEGRLAELNHDLEAMVTERTAALAEEKQANEALAAERMTILDQLAEGVIVTSADGRITFVNEAAANLHGVVKLGITPDEYSKSYQIYTEDGQLYPSEALPLARAVRQDETLVDEHWQIHRPDGKVILAIGSARPVVRGDGAKIGAVLTVRDDTARVTSERALRESAEQVQKLNADLERRVEERTAQLVSINKELESFSYSVSHDLRAPLRSIDGFSQALSEDYADILGPTGKDYLQRVRKESQRMGHLIDDMLSLSRLTRGELRMETINLSDMATEIAEALHTQEPERQSVTFEIQPDLVAQADERLIHAVLQNLIGNAWKFTSHHESAHIRFGAEQRDGKTVFLVKDDGAGFNMAYVDKLFGAFQRLHAMDEFAGSGIGLATVQRIIHRHNGEVWAEGEVEQGATFYFTLAIPH